MRLVLRSLVLPIAVGVALLKAQVAAPASAGPARPPATPPAGIDARAPQQAALAAMEESLAKQRASIQRQAGQSASRGESGGFFVLPAPAPMGAVSGVAEQTDCDPLPAPEVDSLAGKAAAQSALDPALIRSVMQQESAFRPCAVSSKGAMGLMQLMPATASQLGVRNVFDPDQNVDAGARLLKQLMIRYGGDLPKVLAAYNAGPTAVDAAADGVPNIPETVDYIQRILSLLPRL